jgi:hypothetical protein
MKVKVITFIIPILLYLNVNLVAKVPDQDSLVSEKKSLKTTQKINANRSLANTKNTKTKNEFDKISSSDVFKFITVLFVLIIIFPYSIYKIIKTIMLKRKSKINIKSNSDKFKKIDKAS